MIHGQQLCDDSTFSLGNLLCRKSLRLQSAPPIPKAHLQLWDALGFGMLLIPNVIQLLSVSHVVLRHLHFQRTSSQHLDLAGLQTCAAQELEKKEAIRFNLLNDTELSVLRLPSTKSKE